MSGYVLLQVNYLLELSGDATSVSIADNFLILYMTADSTCTNTKLLEYAISSYGMSPCFTWGKKTYMASLCPASGPFQNYGKITGNILMFLRTLI